MLVARKDGHLGLMTTRTQHKETLEQGFEEAPRKSGRGGSISVVCRTGEDSMAFSLRLGKTNM